MPCITTDVGYAIIIVSDKGKIVPIKDFNVFTLCMVKAIDKRVSTFDFWPKRKEAARTRIVNIYSIEVMIEKYNKIWFDII